MARQDPEMQKAKQFAFRDQKTIWRATKQNFIHPCKHFSWPQLRRNAKKNFSQNSVIFQQILSLANQAYPPLFRPGGEHENITSNYKRTVKDG